MLLLPETTTVWQTTDYFLIKIRGCGQFRRQHFGAVPRRVSNLILCLLAAFFCVLLPPLETVSWRYPQSIMKMRGPIRSLVWHSASSVCRPSRESSNCPLAVDNDESGWVIQLGEEVEEEEDDDENVTENSFRIHSLGVFDFSRNAELVLESAQWSLDEMISNWAAISLDFDWYARMSLGNLFEIYQSHRAMDGGVLGIYSPLNHDSNHTRWHLFCKKTTTSARVYYYYS